jgi:hypothetical protein
LLLLLTFKTFFFASKAKNNQTRETKKERERMREGERKRERGRVRERERGRREKQTGIKVTLVSKSFFF